MVVRSCRGRAPAEGRRPLMRQVPSRPGAALLAAGFAALLLLSGAAQAQSCTTIGSSTFCGARGSHNTVGNTMIFNNGPAGQRVGDYAVIGTPPRTQVIDRKSTRLNSSH